MLSNDLQKLMIINKSQKLAWTIKSKSLLLDFMTWSLWSYIAFFLVNQWERIVFFPMIDRYFFYEIIAGIFLLVFWLLVVTVSWSKVSKP